MIDLFKQFFSFEKLMKDRLVATFFFLGLVVVVMTFFGTILSGLGMMGHNFIAGLGLLVWAFFRIIFLFVGLRLACELMVAIFRIKDTLAPDGGKSDTADLDPFEAARDVATKAAKSASSATKTVVEKTKTKLHDITDDDEDDETFLKPAPKAKTTKPVQKTAKPVSKTKKVVTKTSGRKPSAKKTVSKAVPKTTKVKTAKTKTVKAKTGAKKASPKKTAKKPAAKK